jgi:hypothetical protein
MTWKLRCIEVRAEIRANTSYFPSQNGPLNA